MVPIATRRRRNRGSLANRIAFRSRSPDRLRPFDEELLARVGSEPITKIVVLRQPLNRFFRTFLKTLLRRKLSEILGDPYEKLFHLSLWINDKYLLEKTAVVRFYAYDIPLHRNVETFPVAIPDAFQRSVRELIEGTLEHVGAARFASYEAFSRNCQHFAMDVLVANALSSAAAKTFILQDAASILAALPRWVQRVFVAATNTAARIDHVYYGASVSPPTEERSMYRLSLLLLEQIQDFRDIQQDEYAVNH